MGLRGLADTGRPPLFKLARDSISSVSSGMSAYSSDAMTCASTYCKLDRKERRDTGFFMVIGFPHAKNMAMRATRCIPHHHHQACKQTKTNDAGFTIVLSRVLDLQGRSRKHDHSISEIQTTLSPCFFTLGWIKGDAHGYRIYTNTGGRYLAGKDTLPARGVADVPPVPAVLEFVAGHAVSQTIAVWGKRF